MFGRFIKFLFITMNLKKKNSAVLFIQTQEKNLVNLENFIKKNQVYNYAPFVGFVNIDRINQEFKDFTTKQIINI